MKRDWFRNTTWNEAVEQSFDEKLRLAKKKEQYLRIQASLLARSHPNVALMLLGRYFELHDDFGHAQAHADRARALIGLGRVNDAIASYEAALASEVEFPQLRTQTYLDLPYLIATCGIREQYDRALQVLQSHEARLTFPADDFRWHAARALIAADSQEPGVARTHAEAALDAANREDSGFRYHPSVGLVTEQYDDVILRLKAHFTASQ